MIKFLTITSDLEYVANSVFSHFDGDGFHCEVEPKQLEYPERPIATAEHGGETTIILAVSSLDEKQIAKWVQCAKSMISPTKLMFALPIANVDGGVATARALGVGVASVDDNSICTIIHGGRDLTFDVHLPDTTDDKRELKRLLSPSYVKFDQGDWRDAYEEACICLEQVAREYFEDAVTSGRLATQTKSGKTNTPTAKKIQTMTIGTLHKTFSIARNSNSTDQMVVDTLGKINGARIGVAHRRRMGENEWRAFVKPNMHAIVNCLRNIV